MRDPAAPQSATPPPGGRRRFLFGLIAFGLATIVALALAEAVVRLLGLSPGIYRVQERFVRLSANPVLGYELVPFGYAEANAINGDGRRDFHYARRKPDGATRIAVVGDSIAYGAFVRLWETFPKQLEWLLNDGRSENDGRYEVWNFGVPGYSIPEEVEAIRSRVAPTDPNWILIAYCLNDPDPFSFDATGLFVKEQWRDETFRRGLRDAWMHSPTRRLLYEHSRLFVFVRYRYLSYVERRHGKRPEMTDFKRQKHVFYRDQFDKGDRHLEEFLHERHWDRVQTGFAEIAAIPGLDPGRVIVAVFPTLDDWEPYPHEALHEKVIAEAARHGFRTIDLLDDFRAAEQRCTGRALRRDEYHPSPFGHYVAAEALVRHLADLGVVPPDRIPAGADLEQCAHDSWAPEWDGQDMARIERGLVRMGKGDCEGAVPEFDAALALNPDNPIAREAAVECAQAAP